MRIGIVIAMDKEFAQVRSLLVDESSRVKDGQTFVMGTIGCNEVVMMQCGIGKVNAAMGTTALIDYFNPDVVVSTGVAGGASTSLCVQDVVVSTQTCYHDVYCGNEVDYGQVMGLPTRFEACKELVDKAKKLVCKTRIVAGVITSGDWFVDSREKMRDILAHVPDAMAVDMESAAISQVCYRRGIKFISFRIISDVPLKDNRASQYFDFWERLAENSFDVTRQFLEAL